MTIESTEKVEVQELSLAVLDKREADLIVLSQKYKDLTIKGVEDKEGYKLVHDGRMELKNTRVAITKDAKALRDPAIAFQKKVIEKENSLIAIIDKEEARLAAEEKRIDDEKSRIKAEEERKETERINARMNQLSSYGYAADFMTIKHQSDEKFAETLTEAKHQYDLEQARLAAEAERIENEKIEFEKQKVEQERVRKEQEEREAELRKKTEEFEAAKKKEEEDRLARIKADQEKLAAERKAIEDEKKKIEDDRLREIETKKREAEAAENARIETEARLKREAIEKSEKEEAERIAAIEAELAKPDKEIFNSLISELESLAAKYEFKSKKFKKLHEQVNAALHIISNLKSKI